MMNFRLLIIPTVLLLTAACTQHLRRPETEKEHESKNDPYDHFTFQRTYPDTFFDWRAYRKLISSARVSEAAADRNANPCGPVSVSSTPWTLQGPANVAGRVNTLAVKPNDENTLLAGFAGGGIFKSTNAGVNWTPVFDDFPELSIGKITFDPSNPNIAYAGTGDVNMPSILYNGDGIYKSTDAGDTWQYLGLKDAGVISQIIVHPSNPQTIWVATMGNPYTRTIERGVYKTNNGGQTWQKVLFVSDQAGCSSLVMSAANPQILYASFWDRLRNNYESFVWGPHAVVYKSTDGGNNWTQLGGGLPTGNNGRTGLAVSQQNPDKAYIVYIDSLSTPGSMFKTTDGGNTWTPINIVALEDATGDFGWYFGKLSLNPNNDEDIYFHGILLYQRLTNGNWIVASGGHADSHDLVFCPSGRRYWSNDGGVYRNEPGQQAWIKSKNLPATQVYRTSYNPHNTNEYWLGSQDNGVQRGNSSNINNWVSVISADGFRSIFGLYSGDTVWTETQNGTLTRSVNGGNWSSTNTAFGTMDRVNWDAPVFRSLNSPFRFYAATYRLLTSPDGSGFGGGSQDLTDGVVIAPRFHTVSYISESPVTADKIFAGTSDGNVWRREPGGAWSNITAGLPDRYVTSVIGSPTLSNRIFTTHSGFRDDDYIPHIHRSDNNGSTWTDISGDLPQVPVNQLFIVPGSADSILVAATDAGAYATRNSGGHWFRLGSNLPAVPVFDFAHNVAQKQLVAGTFGRGIWTFPIDSIKAQSIPAPPTFVNVDGLIKNSYGAGVAFTTFPDLNPSAISDTTGYYSIDSLSSCNEAIIKPYRNDDPVNGVTAYDFVLISRHILNLEPISSPYSLIAADANKSGTVTTFDIVLLRKLLLGVDTAFTANTSWRFIPESFQFTHLDNPFIDSFPESIQVNLEQLPMTIGQFRGIKVGDVDNTHIAHFNSELEDRNLTRTGIPVTDRLLQAGSVASLPFSVQLDNISAVQFTIRFNPEILQWQTPTELADGIRLDEHFNITQAEKGIVTFAFEPGNADDKLFNLQFKVLQSADFQSAIHINSDLTRALVFDRAGHPARPVLQWQQPLTAGFEIAPNPSPVSGCSLRAAADGHIRITDVTGRTISRTPVAAQQTHWISGLRPGIYQVEYMSGGWREAKQLIVQ